MFDIFKRIKKLEEVVGEKKSEEETGSFAGYFLYSMFSLTPRTLFGRVESLEEDVEGLRKKIRLMESYLNIEVITTEETKGYKKCKKVEKSKHSDCDDE